MKVVPIKEKRFPRVGTKDKKASFQKSKVNAEEDAVDTERNILSMRRELSAFNNPQIQNTAVSREISLSDSISSQKVTQDYSPSNRSMNKIAKPKCLKRGKSTFANKNKSLGNSHSQANKQSTDFSGWDVMPIYQPTPIQNKRTRNRGKNAFGQYD